MAVRIENMDMPKSWHLCLFKRVEETHFDCITTCEILKGLICPNDDTRHRYCPLKEIKE